MPVALRSRRARLGAAAAAGVAALTCLAVPAAQAATTTVTVTENNIDSTAQGAWSTADTDNGAAVSFVSGPAGAPLGTGSLQLSIPATSGITTPAAKAHALTLLAAPVKLADIDAVTYATYRDGSSTIASFVAPAVNMEVCAGGIVNGACLGYTTLVYEPLYAYGNDAIHDNEWQTWDAVSGGTSGGWWSTRNLHGLTAFTDYATLGEIAANNPDAVAYSIAVNVGHGPAGGFLGNVDALTLGAAGTTTVYNFEHLVSLDDKTACKDGGWKTSSDPVFVNQGDCVSYFASNGKSHGQA